MTHRAALIFSLLLTLVVGAGVFAGRDRLFAPESAASSYTATSPAAQSPGDNQEGELTSTNPRIVTVTLPPTLTANSASTQARGEHDEGSFDHDRDDHEEEHDDD